MPVQGSFHTTRVHASHPSPASCHLLSYTTHVSDMPGACYSTA